MAILQAIVRALKGFVEVRSSPGCGTTFRVFLPASEKKLPTGQAAGTPRRQVRGAATILVVDDDERVRNLTCINLKRHGYEVLGAQDGQDALRVLANASSLPSLARVDLAMPVMGGDELVPILEMKYPALKVIICSGYPEERARQRFSPASNASFLQKPYTRGAMVSMIEEMLCGTSHERPVHPG